MLADSYSLADREPNIQVWAADNKGNRSLTLHHTQHKGRDLNDQTRRVLKYVRELWGFDVYLDTTDSAGFYKGRVGAVIR